MYDIMFFNKKTINDKGVTAEATREITITNPEIQVKEVKIDTVSI